MKKREIWFTKAKPNQCLSDYGLHPGALLSQYIAWQRPSGGYATIPDPEPDTINVAVLAKKPIVLDLPHVYHLKPQQDPRFWISFGTSDNPKKTIDSVKEFWIAAWTNPTANPPRPYIHQEFQQMFLAKDIPAGTRWQYIEQFCE